MDVLENGGVLQCVKTRTKRRNKINWNKFIWLLRNEKIYIYIYIYIYILLYMYIGRRKNFYSVKLEKDSKENKFQNSFGYEDEKIIF